MRIGINLLMVRPQKSGGQESFINNLIEGFFQYAEDDFEFLLFVTKNNKNIFLKYTRKDNFKLVVCNLENNNVIYRIVWENLLLNKILKKNKVDVIYSPVYSKPFCNARDIKYIVTIHDLQALHYPENFSKLKLLWLKIAWKICAKTADNVIATTNFVKEDIIRKLQINKNKISVISIPIINNNIFADFDNLHTKFNILRNDYFYTVSSLEPNKNLKTLIYVIKEIRDNKYNLPTKLVITGVNGKSESELLSIVKQNNLNSNIIFTGFISNEERDSLYKNAKAFLFSSIFEGFGMPPIEALLLGTKVITTIETSIPEVTKGQAYYINNAFSVDEWIKKIQEINNYKPIISEFPEYGLELITILYLNKFKEVFNF